MTDTDRYRRSGIKMHQRLRRAVLKPYRPARFRMSDRGDVEPGRCLKHGYVIERCCVLWETMP